jgi:ATP-dependent Clp protease ATP-binding subunit ClpA
VTPETDLLERDRFDDRAADCLMLAAGVAQLTRHPRVRADHVLVALLQSDDGEIEAACEGLLRGVTPVALADVIRERLEIHAESEDCAPGNFSDGLPRIEDLEPSAIDLVTKAGALAREWDAARVPHAALACAACLAPDEITLSVLRRAGIPAQSLGEAATRLEGRARASQARSRPVELFRGGVLSTELFEPVLQAALLRLAPVSVSRVLLDADLVRELVEQEHARLRALVIAAGITSEHVRAALSEIVSPEIAPEAVGRTTIQESSIGRLLKRILADAAGRAQADRAERILESHVLLAHLERVAAASGNVYERIGLQVDAIRKMLVTDVPPPPEEDDGTFVDGGLAWDAFGPLAAAAWRTLIPIAAERTLLDSDLVWAFLSLPDSHLTEALHVAGAPLPMLRRALRPQTQAAETSAAVATSIPRERVGKLLCRVIAAASALAQRERQPVIGESQLLRAHIDLVSAGSGNVYERFGIDGRSLQASLSHKKTDAEPGGTSAPAGGDPGADIEGYLRGRVINQEHAVARAARALRRMRSGLGEPGQVLGKFLFLGATGVGKTELARAMADIAFGIKPGEKDACMIRLDCGNFTDRRDIVQLIGASQGLVGYKEGQLTNGLRARPHAVILFDEAEKADKGIWQSLLPLFDEGIVREADGTVYDATNCLMIATSNKGYEEAIAKHDVFRRNWADVRADVEQSVWEALPTYFSREFLGRFGRENVIFFEHFTRDSYARIVDLQIRGLQEEMTRRGIELTFDNPKTVGELLADLAWESRAEGARPVRRLITERLRDRMIAVRAEDPTRTRFRFVCRPGASDVALES